jgi:uncharacterized small protein (DUF1192 family)
MDESMTRREREHNLRELHELRVLSADELAAELALLHEAESN